MKSKLEEENNFVNWGDKIKINWTYFWRWNQGQLNFREGYKIEYEWIKIMPVLKWLIFKITQDLYKHIKWVRMDVVYNWYITIYNSFLF